MVTRFTLPHIDISDRAITRPYQAPQQNMGGGSAPRVREAHGRRLQAQLNAAFGNADEAIIALNLPEPPTGVYLEVELRPATKVDKVLDKKNAGIKSAATRVEAADNNEVTKVALFVPDEARPILQQILEDYATGPTTAANKPKHQATVEPIEAIRQARLETFWTDSLDKLPADPQEVIWWEVWCFKSLTTRFLERVAVFGARAASQEHHLNFPEFIVVPVLANRVTIELMLFATLGISELRRASATPVFFVDQNRESQLEWAENLAQRITWPGNDAPAVCLLDTGVNRGHILIEPALSPENTLSLDDAWGVDDAPEGHGTGMAGLALHGDLLAPLSDEREIVLRHRLESVKILPPNGFPANDPRSYGPLTQAAASRAEIAAPHRPRVFCLSVTNDNVSGAKPTTWSAAIDQAVAGRMAGDEDNAPRRLFFISAGNAPAHIERGQILASDEYPIEDPAQSWNAITVGGYTDKIVIDDQGYDGWTPFSPAGDLSPFTRTSVTWPQSKAPLKPEIVMEAGNRAISPDGGQVLSLESLALLTTGAEVAQHALISFSATSAATAQAARMAAMLSAEHPDFWPETIRALMIHSAEWTEPMRTALDQVGKRQRYALLRKFGYGVPNLERAMASARNHLALVAQNTIFPYRHTDGRKFRDCHFFRLPWPRDVLEGLGEQEVRLKLTLSYFIQPNPGASSSIDPQRYQSHGLRFDLKRRHETDSQFIQRINTLEREDGAIAAPGIADDGWRFGPQSISSGSLHCDEWTGPAVQLAERDIICIKPVMGWWRNRGSIEQCNQGTRYSLIATLSTEQAEIDFHTPIMNMIDNEIPVEIAFNDAED